MSDMTYDILVLFGPILLVTVLLFAWLIGKISKG